MSKPPLTHTSAQALVSYLTVEQHQAGRRIDNFLLAHLKGVPKSLIYRILRSGEVRVNRGRTRPDYRLCAGDAIRIPPLRQSPEKPPARIPQNFLETLERAIVYQDKGLLIINKPSGLAVHGGSGIRLGLIEGLRRLYPRHAYLELVHRLDRDTSGCLLLAKKPARLRELQKLLREGQIRKNYIALVKGTWPAHLKHVEAPLKKYLLKSGERRVSVHPEGKQARTHFTVLRRFSQADLLGIRLITGRTHQIRVHTAHQGHPVAGDDKYGDAGFNQVLRAVGLRRLFLHAERLRVPLSEGVLDISAPLPGDLESVLRKLENAD